MPLSDKRPRPHSQFSMLDGPTVSHPSLGAPLTLESVCIYLQVVHDNYLLYVFAPDRESRQRWVLALKEGNYSPV